MTGPAAQRTVRALVVEAATPQRSRLLEVLSRDGDIVVVGLPTTAAATVEAVAHILPDIVVLDLDLPSGEGVIAIDQIMARYPTPIILLSAPVRDRVGARTAAALTAGAVAVLPRPALWTPELGHELRRAVRQVSRVHVIRHAHANPAGSPAGASCFSAADREPGDRPGRSQAVVAIGSSTGGPKALATILPGLAGLRAAVLIVQHLHPDFTSGLVEWMARVSALPVEIAGHQQTVHPGHVYIAPGGQHLHYGANNRLLLETSPVTVHRPSADELFLSVAEVAGTAGVGVLLTGMGEDGAKGLLAMHRQGAITFAQDEDSCAVFGMPRAAARLGAVSDMLPLDKVAAGIQRAVRGVRV